jgi:hypothetical protein
MVDVQDPFEGGLSVNGQVKMDINGHEKYPPTAK